MSLKQKIILLVAVSLALAWGVIGFVIVELRAQDGTLTDGATHTELIASSNLPLLITIKDIKTDVIQVQQWLTDISATRGRPGFDDGFAEAARYAKKFAENVARARAEAKAIGNTPVLTALDELEKVFASYYADGQAMAHVYVEQGPDVGNRHMAQFDSVAKAMGTATDKLVSMVEGESRQTLQALSDKSHQVAVTNHHLVRWLIGISIAAGLFSLVYVVLLFRSVGKSFGHLNSDVQTVMSGDEDRPLHLDPDRNDEFAQVAGALAAFRVKLAETAEAEAQEARRREQQRAVVGALSGVLERLSRGDLTAHLGQVFPAEYEQLRSDFNEAVAQLRETVAAVSTTVAGIFDASNEIAQGAEDLSRRTENQAATLEETAAAMDELTVSVNSAAEGTARADQVVSEARQGAEASGQIVLQAVGAMNEIEESSKEISQIIGVIDDIAFQTNLLALNAGVEAARAGEAGRGFAVVASEVRALAQRSSEAARRIKDLISTSSTHVGQGVTLVGRAGEALQQIVEDVTNISGLVSNIATSSREQSIGLGEITGAVTQLDQVTQQNAAMVEETTAASHSMRRDATRLSELVARFRLADATAPTTAPAIVRGAPAVSEGTVVSAPLPVPAPIARGNTALASDPADDQWREF